MQRGCGAQPIPVYAEAGVVAISGSATSTELTTAQPEGKFFFRTAYRNDLQGAFIGIFAANQLQGESSYLIDYGEEYGVDLADAAEQAMEASGIAVTRESIERGSVDFTPLAQEIASANPEFVGFAGFNPEAALFYRQLRDAGYEADLGAGDVAGLVFATLIGPVARRRRKESSSPAARLNSRRISSPTSRVCMGARRKPRRSSANTRTPSLCCLTQVQPPRPKKGMAP